MATRPRFGLPLASAFARAHSGHADPSEQYAERSKVAHAIELTGVRPKPLLRQVLASGLKWAFLLAVSSVVTMPPVWADDGVDTWVEFHKHVEGAEHVAALEEGFAGDNVSLYDGATTFSIVDINVPGNSSLPVQLVRSISIELQVQSGASYDDRLLGAGNWDVDVPYITATYPSPAAYSGSPGWQSQRCSGRSSPDLSLPAPFWDSDVWSGITIHIPGRGNTKALAVNASVLMPTIGGPYHLTTPARDAIDCIQMKQSGFSGEGFRLTTTAGIQYYFDYGVTRVASTLRKWWSDAGQTRLLSRYRYYILASKIQDRYGNWVQFQYNSAGHPTRIWSNDGREIDPVYDGDKLDSATSDGRTWHYNYLGGNLKGVTLPDNSRWQYTYSGSLTPPMPPPGESFINNRCQIPPALIDDAYTLTATSPSGATASFQFQNTRHFRSGVIVNECINIGDSLSPLWYLRTPYFFDVMSLTQKTISGPGIPTGMTWGYHYDPAPKPLWGTVNGFNPYPCTTCALGKTNTVTEPNGTQRSYQFGIEYALNDGRQLEADTVADGSTVRSRVDDYMPEAAVSGQPFYPQYGDVLDGVGDPASAFIRPIVQSQITQDNATFTTATNTFDFLARPLKQTESSSLDYSRVDETTYHDDTGLWVLGQVQMSKVAGIVAAKTTSYNGKAQPLTEEHFGLVSTNAWNTDGTLLSITDGRTYAVKFSGWKRGIPQQVKYDDNTGESAVVNDSGWITSVTDENLYTTGYQYDDMGRIKEIDYPNDANNTWRATTISFGPDQSIRYGIPAGHWAQVIQTGGGYTVTYFDALWRPLVTDRFDVTDPADTRSQTVTRYDKLGRKIFTSYPLRNPSLDYSTANTGTHTTYDALDRPTQINQDSELGTLTTHIDHLADFETKATNPRGYSTLTSYQAWGEPTTQFPDSVTAPEGELTIIQRDAFGKPLSITRTGTAQDSPEFTRHYVYDGNQQLCKRIDPESGATAFGYDAVGNLLWSAAGLDLPSTTSCDADAAHDSGRRVDRTYYIRNRLHTVVFPDGNGNQTWTYYPDGLPKQVTTGNPNDTGQNSVANSYFYDARRLLTEESLSQPGVSTWTVDYGYNANGDVALLTYPDGSSIAYAPNALGQPTRVGNQISGVTYFPDGKVSTFSTANGIAHTLDENVRGLPWHITDASSGGAALAQTYTYDQNGNLKTLTDTATPSQNRSMVYDQLDRLQSGTVAYQGSTPTNYDYDVLDNLTQATQGTRIRIYNHDTTNRLVSVQDSGGPSFGLTWDVQGNLATVGPVTAYTFDYGNRLRAVIGNEGNYAYDAFGRRVSATDSSDQLGILSMYTRDGQLIYQDNQRTSLKHDYLYLGSRLVAVVDKAYDGSARVVYQHTDAQGSIVAETNAAPMVTERTAYSNWGAPLNHDNEDEPGYTGHLQDSLTGLTYMQQRYYSPTLSAFLSTDPVGVDAAMGGNFNRYWYAKDNPYRYTDPDGRESGAGYATGEYTIALPPSSPEAREAALTMAAVGGVIIATATGADEVVGVGLALRAGGRYVGAKIVGAVTRRAVANGSPKIDPKDIAGKSPAEIDAHAKGQGLIAKGPSPSTGKGAYVDPATGNQRVLVHSNAESPHAHVNNPAGERLNIDGKKVSPEAPGAHLPIKKPGDDQ